METNRSTARYPNGTHLSRVWALIFSREQCVVRIGRRLPELFYSIHLGHNNNNHCSAFRSTKDRTKASTICWKRPLPRRLVEFGLPPSLLQLKNHVSCGVLSSCWWSFKWDGYCIGQLSLEKIHPEAGPFDNNHNQKQFPPQPMPPQPTQRNQKSFPGCHRPPWLLPFCPIIMHGGRVLLELFNSTYDTNDMDVHPNPFVAS